MRRTSHPRPLSWRRRDGDAEQGQDAPDVVLRPERASALLPTWRLRSPASDIRANPCPSRAMRSTALGSRTARLQNPTFLRRALASSPGHPGAAAVENDSPKSEAPRSSRLPHSVRPDPAPDGAFGPGDGVGPAATCKMRNQRSGCGARRLTCCTNARQAAEEVPLLAMLRLPGNWRVGGFSWPRRPARSRDGCPSI